MTTKTTTSKKEEVTPARRILVFQGKKSFLITVPEDAKTTFGPWSPPGMRDRFGGGSSDGTLRVYGRTEKHVLAVFSGVTGFRDLSLGYTEVEASMLGGFSDEEEDEEYNDEESERSITFMPMSPVKTAKKIPF